MSAEYSVEEVRAEADRHARVFDEVPMRMLTAYAGLLERIKADEAASGRIDFNGMWNAMSDQATTRPPAQAAQVDKCGLCDGPNTYDPESGVCRKCQDVYDAPTAEPVAQGEAEMLDQKQIGYIKQASGYHLRDGTGASDALYSLAVKHGASETEAAGFAHHVNGAMNELQGCVYSMATIAQHPAQPSRAVDAWMTDDGRVISDRQKATAIKDGGASASSVAPYAIPLTRAIGNAQSVDVDAIQEIVNYMRLYPFNAHDRLEIANKLTAALTERGNG